MEFEPEYYSGFIKVFTLTLLISILPIYFIENKIIIQAIIAIVFLTILILKNKKWIKKIQINFINTEIKVEYPLCFLGQKRITVLFSEINKIVYYDYLYRTPVHFIIEFSNQILRLDCNEKESKKVSFSLKNNGIETKFYNNKEVGYR